MTMFLSARVFDAALLVTAALFIIVTALTILLLVSKIMRIIFEAEKERLRQRLRPRIMVYLTSRQALDLKELNVKSPLGRRMLDDMIYEMSFQLRGDALDALRDAYHELKLARRQMRHLSSIWWWVRAQACKRLGRFRCEEAHPLLKKRLRDRSPEVRLMAAWALGEMKDQQALPEIMSGLSQYSRIGAMQLVSLAIDAGEPAVEPVMQATNHPDQSVQLLAIQLLGLMRSPNAGGRLEEFLSHGNLEFRLSACQSLGEIGDRAAGPALTRQLVDQTWQMRARAARAVGDMDWSDAIPKLSKNLEDANWWVRHNSAEALSKMGIAGRRAMTRSLRSDDKFARDTVLQWLDESGAVAEALESGEPWAASMIDEIHRVGADWVIESNRQAAARNKRI